jgi:hypothetical protein
MRRLVPRLVMAMGFWCLAHAGAASAGKPVWESLGTIDGVIVSRIEDLETGLYTMRGEGEISFPVDVVFQVMVEGKRANEWVPDVDSEIGKLIVKDVSPMERVELTGIDLPWPVRDRYTLCRATAAPRTEGGWHITYDSLPDPSVISGVAQKVGARIQARVVEGTFDLIALGPAKTRVIATLQVDPGGSVPRFLSNWFARSWPSRFVRNLDRQVARIVAEGQAPPGEGRAH